MVIGSNEDVIKVIEYKFNDKGNKVKITTTTWIWKLAKARLSKSAIERFSSSDLGLKDLAVQPEGFIDKPSASETTVVATGIGKSMTYVPSTLRGGGDRSGMDMKRRNEENAVRVTNLSEDTREPDLLELFRTFGLVSHVYVARSN
uniref:RRM domain-containing protein n=1 Tax=Nelumbo nucifera TaxID=4432 RepID=A0A822XME0_NELNU|nr:TPA_asm: hypothetical protein HUJ06_022983 [Nelumbo nucifera]